MSSKMVVRILSISLALFFLGMVAPSLALDIVAPTSVDFGEVTVGNSGSVGLIITNPWGVTVYLAVVDAEMCDLPVLDAEGEFTVQPGTINFDTAGTENATVTYTPIDEGGCNGCLRVAFSGFPPVYVALTGIGVAAGPKTVIIDGQDTGVENKKYQGETVSYWLDALAAEARNHGEYVRGVALMVRKMHKAGVLLQEDVKVIMKAAAHANIPPVESGLEGLSHDGTPVTELIKGCEEKAENNKQYMRCVSDLMKEMKKAGDIKTRKDKHLIRRYAARLRFHSRHHN